MTYFFMHFPFSDPDDSMYEVIDMNELEDMPVDDACITVDLHDGNFV